MNPVDNHNQGEDEIDLGILLLKITKSISKYKLSLMLFPLIGIALGVGAYYKQIPKYESDMIIKSSILTEAYSNTLTETLERLIKEGNVGLLSQKLGLTEDESSFLSSIQVESISETKTGDDATENRIFKIHVETTSNDILKDLQTGLISFLENNEYVKKRVTLSKNRLEKLISKVGQEIREIDSLKLQINKSLLRQQSGNNNLVVLDPTNVYSKALSLYKDEINYQNNLELSNSIHLIEGFVAFQKPASPKLSISIIIGLFVGFFMAIGIIIFKELGTYLKKLNQEISANS